MPSLNPPLFVLKCHPVSVVFCLVVQRVDTDRGPSNVDFLPSSTNVFYFLFFRKTNPPNSFRNDRGAAYEKDGQHALALADCSMCLSREVGHKFARVRKSRVLEALGKEEDALSEVCAHLLLERDRVQAEAEVERCCDVMVEAWLWRWWWWWWLAVCACDRPCVCVGGKVLLLCPGGV